MDEQNTGPRDASDGVAALRELATRLLTFHFGKSDSEQRGALKLLVGELPPDLPFELPLPEGTRLLGSFTLEDPIIALDSPHEGDEVIAFYRERLTATGWSEPEMHGPRRGGFLPADPSRGAGADFCAPDDRYTLSILTRPSSGDHTSAQLVLHSGSARFRRPFGRDVMATLPLLRPPRGATQMSQGGGGGQDYVESRGALETDLTLEAVANHYLGELERAGWRRLDAGVSGSAAWNAWSFTDEEGAPWQGLLLIIARPLRPGKYALTLQAEAEDESRQGGAGGIGSNAGGYSYSQLLGRQRHVVNGPPKPEPKREDGESHPPEG